MRNPDLESFFTKTCMCAQASLLRAGESFLRVPLKNSKDDTTSFLLVSSHLLGLKKHVLWQLHHRKKVTIIYNALSTQMRQRIRIIQIKIVAAASQICEVLIWNVFYGDAYARARAHKPASYVPKRVFYEESFLRVSLKNSQVTTTLFAFVSRHLLGLKKHALWQLCHRRSCTYLNLTTVVVLRSKNVSSFTVF